MFRKFTYIVHQLYLYLKAADSRKIVPQNYGH